MSTIPPLLIFPSDRSSGHYMVQAGHPLARTGPLLAPSDRELVIAQPLTLAEAIAMVEADGWPDLLSPDSDSPRGLALYPPANGAPVVVQLAPTVRDLLGRPLSQTRVALACLFRVRGRAVLRCSAPGDAQTPALFPVDVRSSEVRGQPAVYAGVGAKRRLVPASLAGWTLGRADPPSDGPVVA